ncbi:DNA methyltransferase [Mycolicibacterium lutetiense]|uniref:DNA modification methylase n=1 Tax=Mycolicibacterium lutetiense TaxID=1641992 RepID=A0ABS4ZSI9_9MYCO|nr:DNA methyltransferase [Mycolicibacterium lutetiense]MBP2452488.1 DNA modification methylase [Mycolicibacterium lutetiense]
MSKNRLFYGDNLKVLKERVATDSVDLIYLDPPFNSEAVYNVTFADAGDASAQIHAFDDTWKWSVETGQQYDYLVSSGLPEKPAETLRAIRALVHETPLTAYMTNMAPRLVELHRVLKGTGSLYLHCDPTASHYLKVMLDAIFGPRCFRSEIIWRRTGAHGKARRFTPVHDVILFYTKSDGDRYTWNRPTLPYMKGHVADYFVQDGDAWRTDYYGNVLTGSGTRNGESGMPWKGFNPTAKGRHWAVPGKLVEDSGEDFTGMTQHQKMDRLYELGYITIAEGETWPIYQHTIKPSDGVTAPDIWAYQPYTVGTVFDLEGENYTSKNGIDADVRWLSPKDRERLGYPTQKPVGLLERILKASSNEGDLVMDPFCGCGTTMDAAIRLKRRWIGIDITYIAVDLIRNRLRTTHGPLIDETYEVLGLPEDLAAAHDLFERDALEFERWAVSLVRGTPNTKQVGDRGRDGIIRYYRGKKEKAGRLVVSVKGGKQLNPQMVRDLAGVIASDDTIDGGVLITRYTPTRGMVQAAADAGSYTDVAGNAYARVQLFTVEELLEGVKPSTPPIIRPYTEARPVEEVVEQLDFGF